jgi:tRNA(fMet)-specific endonuclease VapC
MTIADTDVLIDFLAGVEPAATRVADLVRRSSLYTTVISRFELLAGARGARQAGRILNLLAAVPALPLDAAGADRAAELRRTLERAGQPVGMADSLIAGIALLQDGSLMTRNRRHFERVPGLRLADF